MFFKVQWLSWNLIKILKKKTYMSQLLNGKKIVFSAISYLKVLLP